MELYNLTTNHMPDCLGVEGTPYFSWKIRTDLPDTKQRSYHITVKSEEEMVWDSGTIESNKTAFITYGGKPLTSSTLYRWEVKVEDSHGCTSVGSACFETALLDKDDWKAVWVESSLPLKKRKKGFGNQPAPVFFRRDFVLDQAVKKARLYVTCHGIYEASINGKRVDGRTFAPEYSSYDACLFYQIYDVTEVLQEGKNVLGLYVADGWYFGPNTTMSNKTAKEPYAVLYQLSAELADGREVLFVSDGTEKCAEGPVCFSDLFAGEKYDAGRKIDGWDSKELDDSTWAGVKKKNYPLDNLHAQIGEPVRTAAEVKALRAYISPKGEHIIDFGQNLAGRVRFHVHAPRGTSIVLDHFETTDPDGNYYDNILGEAGIGQGCEQRVEYISDGTEDVYEAKFTFHGFRYVRVSGLSVVDPDDFTAVALSTDKRNVGSFSCSDSRLNRLYENTRWSQRSNMISIPTDCPQREKAGWTGDIGIYARTALQNEDVTGFLTRWLRSVSADQGKDGHVPMVVPHNQTYKSMGLLLGLAGGFKGSIGVAGWGDACVLVPKAMYDLTGNKEVLRQQYDSMKKWADFILHTAAKYRGNRKIPRKVDRLLWNTGFHYGEWLIPSRTKNGLADTSAMQQSMKEGKQYIPEIFSYVTMRNVAEIAGILEKEEDQKFYANKARLIRRAFCKGVITEDGGMPVDVMGAYVIPLHYGLVPRRLRESFIQTVLKKIEENQGCLDTGFLGTPVLLDTLCEYGYVKEAYDLLFQEKCPSWLYEVNHGATTIWESWITTKEDGSPMNVSLNHYAFGCVDDWMFRYINGIVPLSPGYETFKVAPFMDDRISWAERTFESEYGPISSRWEKKDGTFTLTVKVPPCTTCHVVLPTGEEYTKGSGEYTFTWKA